MAFSGGFVPPYPSLFPPFPITTAGLSSAGVALRVQLLLLRVSTVVFTFFKKSVHHAQRISVCIFYFFSTPFE